MPPYAKPSATPRWSDTVEGDITRVREPPDSKKDVGYAPAEQPASAHFNWLLNLLWHWTLYMSTLETLYATLNWAWTGTHTFSIEPTAPDYFSTSLRAVFLGPSNFRQDSAGDWTYLINEAAATAAAPGKLWIDIPVTSGDLLDGVLVDIQHSVATAGSMVATLYNITTGGSTGAALAGPISSTASAAAQTLDFGPLGLDCGLGGDVQYVVVEITNAHGAMTRDVFGARKKFKHDSNHT